MMRKTQEAAPVQPENRMTSSPLWVGTWWVPVVVWPAPAGEVGWQFGLSDILAAAAHPAERRGH